VKHKIHGCIKKGDLLMKLKQAVCTVVIVIAVILMLLSLGYGFLRDIFFPIRTVQVLNSPDGKHRAVLRRIDGIDVNFFIIVDRKQVYWSPDFAPNSRVDFKERLIWNKTGDIVILEVVGRRLFGYNAQTCKAVSDAELLSIEYSPEPNEWEYGFEGTWPDERVKHSPEATEK
jgi:hypothetical protein